MAADKLISNFMFMAEKGRILFLQFSTKEKNFHKIPGPKEEIRKKLTLIPNMKHLPLDPALICLISIPFYKDILKPEIQGKDEVSSRSNDSRTVRSVPAISQVFDASADRDLIH